MTFRQVPIGARFKFLGVVYTKTAHSMAQDKNLIDWIFGHNEWDDKKSAQRVVELLPESHVENPNQPAFTA